MASEREGNLVTRAGLSLRERRRIVLTQYLSLVTNYSPFVMRSG